MINQIIGKYLPRTNFPSHDLLFNRWEFSKEVEKYNDRLRLIAIEEDGRMSRRLARLDKTSESIRTVIGGIPDDVLIDLLRIGDNWTISHTVIDIYDEEALKKIVSEDLEKYWLKRKHMKNKPIREPRPEVWVHGHIEFHIQPRTISFSCPICGCPLSKVHQWEERGYSHIKAFGCTTKLVVRLPKMRCGCCGGWPQLEPEWVRPGSSYTVPFEKLAFSLIRNTSVSCVEEILDISDTTLWRMIDYRVSEALNYLDLSNTYAIYIDEKSKKKGQNYVTVVLDQCGSVIFVCDGRGSDTVSKFASWLESHSGRKENIIAVSCDLGESYPAGVRREFPDATIVYDHYHTMKIVDEKFETVYSRCLNLDNHLLGKKRLLQKRSRELDDKQENVVQYLLSRSEDLGRAYRLKEMFSYVYDMGSRENAESFLDYWIRYAASCGIPEMESASRSIERHRDGILNWYEHPINNSLLEGVNSAIQTIKQDARGYGCDQHYIHMIYLRCGNLRLSIDPDFRMPPGYNPLQHPLNGMVRVRCPNCKGIGFRMASRASERYEIIPFVDSTLEGVVDD